MHPKAEQAAHTGPDRLRIKEVGTGADQRHILDAEAQGGAQNGSHVPGIPRAVQHHMGTGGIQRILKLFEHRGGVAVFLPADPAQRPVGFLDPDSQIRRHAEQPLQPLPGTLPGSGMHQQAAHPVRPVQQAFHARKNARGIAVIQFRFVRG